MSFWASLIRPRTLTAKGLIITVLLAVVAAEYLGYLDPIEAFLNSDDLTFRFLDASVSPFKIIKAAVVLIVFLWFASFMAGQLERRLGALKKLRPSNRELLSKAGALLIYFFFGVIALDMIGIDLAALTVVGGAIGIGIGVGLQKISSNFISGIILLAEKSVEVGDLIELDDGTQGFVRQAGARYTLLETFDGKEVMVPNEDFITNRVVNWTLTTNQGRVKICVGVAYGSDLELVRRLLLEAATDHPRAALDPGPICFLEQFGDSSIDFSLYFWVDDVTVGRREPRSDVLFSIWHKFEDHGISIPYPQRDVHIRSGASMPEGCQ